MSEVRVWLCPACFDSAQQQTLRLNQIEVTRILKDFGLDELYLYM